MTTNQNYPSPNDELSYSIGEIVSLTGISHGLLRLWEREGLITPQRTPGGHRFYTHSDLLRLRHIAHLRRVEHLNSAAILREIGPNTTNSPISEVSENDPSSPSGLQLRVLRTQQNLSLAEVADRSGLSISFLSAVERGQASISLGNLFKLADALGTTVPGLNHSHQRKQHTMLHPQQRPRFIADHGRVTIEDLITRPSALEAQRIEILPGGGSEEAYSHPGEEFIYILTGQLTFWIAEQDPYTLHEGDSLSFLSTQLHSWRNETPQPVTVLWVNVPLIEIPSNPSQSRHKAHTRDF